MERPTWLDITSGPSGYKVGGPGGFDGFWQGESHRPGRGPGAKGKVSGLMGRVERLTEKEWPGKGNAYGLMHARWI